MVGICKMMILIAIIKYKFQIRSLELKNFMILFLVFLMIFPFVISESFADHSPEISISVDTDKKLYTVGDAVIISGQIAPIIIEDGRLNLQIFNGADEFIYEDYNVSKNVNEDGTFRYGLGFDEFLINEEDYLVRASWITENSYSDLHPDIPLDIDDYGLEIAYVDGNFAETTFSYPQTQNWIVADKDIYKPYDTIIINGHTSEQSNLISLNSNYLEIMINSYFEFSYVAGNNDSLFSYNGTDAVKLMHGTDEVARTTFTIDCSDDPDKCNYIPEPIIEPINPLTIQTDKEEYYLNNNIFINGTIIEIDQSTDTTITYDITYSDNIIQTGNTTLQEDETFNFTIDTSEWDIGSHIITVTIQDFTADTSIYYHNTPNMTPEANYEKIMIQQDTDEEHREMLDDHGTTMTTQDTMMYSQDDKIKSIKDEQTKQQGILDIIMGILEGILGAAPPIPADAPIIISLTADDPDNLDDIYSIEDTITIQFDSNTNTPGGIGLQKKQQVDDLFTFTDIPAQAYNGQWITSNTFVITIKSINNAEITIGQTRVTPTGTTPILPADNTPDASYLTSPVLDGDWGILYPEGYTPEPEIKCGRGTELVDGYCQVL